MFKEDFREPGDEKLKRENETGKNEESPLVNTPVKVLSATSIIGDDVENLQGENLGEINDIVFNIQTGCTEYVVLEFGGFLGMGEKLFAIPFKALSLNADRQVFILDRDKDYLKKAPGFDKDHWPETNSRHWEDINTYWAGYGGPIYPAGNTFM